MHSSAPKAFAAQRTTAAVSCVGAAIPLSREPRDPQAADIDSQRIAKRHGNHRVIESIGSVENRHHRAEILHAPRHRPDLPQRFDPPSRARHMSRARQTARRRFDSRDATEVRGKPYAAGRVAT